MEGNLHAPDRAKAVNGCRKRESLMSSDKYEHTGDNLRDFNQRKEITGSGLPVEEPTSTEWTNEKHSLYLNSMEASFVNQLYNHKYISMDLHPKKNNPPSNNNYSSSRISSGQFKVHRDGCWQKVNFERDQPELGIADESCVLMESPWIRHFKSVHKCQDVMSLHQNEKGGQGSEETHFGRRKTHCYGLAASSKQNLAYQTHFCHRDSVGSNAEASGQNFVNEDHEEEKLSSLCRKKKMKTMVADVSSQYQVVPPGESFLEVNPKGKVCFHNGGFRSS